MGPFLPIVTSVMEVLGDPRCAYELVLYKQGMMQRPPGSMTGTNKRGKEHPEG